MGAVEKEETTQPLWMTACEDLGDNGSDIVSNEPTGWSSPTASRKALRSSASTADVISSVGPGSWWCRRSLGDQGRTVQSDPRARPCTAPTPGRTRATREGEQGGPLPSR